jgi:hypothetical protein
MTDGISAPSAQSIHPGATSQEWDHFVGLGIAHAMVPIVSNARLPISPESKLRDVGKVPSTVNKRGEVTGYAKWTKKVTTEAQIEHWRSEPQHYGFGIKGSEVAGVDIDIDDPELARGVYEALVEALGAGSLPRRTRADSPRMMVPLRVGDGIKPPKPIKCVGGVIEVRATGHQWVAAGTHPKGARYEWPDGFPARFEHVTIEQFAAAWAALAARFGSGVDGAKIKAADAAGEASLPDENRHDPVADWLQKYWECFKRKGGKLNVRCPWCDNHSADSGESQSTWLLAGYQGNAHGTFRCLHAGCSSRSQGEFLEAVGYADVERGEALQAFEWMPGGQRFEVLPADVFARGKPLEWIVKGVIPDAALIVVYGASGSGKTFAVLDLVAAIARGREWRGLRVRQRRVVYIAAEGVSGFRQRVKALATFEGVEPGALGLGIIAEAPDLRADEDIKALTQELVRAKPGLVVVDTLAQVTPGADENSGEDMGAVLKKCRRLHEATGAAILLIHHSGKDASKGARGWSGVKAAADAEIEVSRTGEARVLTVTKQKDGGDGTQFGFTLQPVVLGTDVDGDPITSCVVVPCEVAPTTARPRGKWQEAVFRTVEGIVGLSGDAAPLDAVMEHIGQSELGGTPRWQEQVKRALSELCRRSTLRVSGDGYEVGA